MQNRNIEKIINDIVSAIDDTTFTTREMILESDIIINEEERAEIIEEVESRIDRCIYCNRASTIEYDLVDGEKVCEECVHNYGLMEEDD